MMWSSCYLFSLFTITWNIFKVENETFNNKSITFLFGVRFIFINVLGIDLLSWKSVIGISYNLEWLFFRPLVKDFQQYLNFSMMWCLLYTYRLFVNLYPSCSSLQVYFRVTLWWYVIILPFLRFVVYLETGPKPHSPWE